ncbi:MAG: polysaccharide biosynthesis C-terminal domain-containing protein, partial [Muribaculaceae bacterium]|nr:polysaccharide biosynthesis C-terminal domain-containing protein [Muribaculaceae bacterium]
TSTLLIPLCFSLIKYPIHAINLNLLQVKGRSDLFLKLEIIKKIVGVVFICLSLPFGIIALCWMTVVNSLIALVINTHYTGKLINLGFIAQMKDLLPTLTLSMGTGAIVYLTVTYILMESWLALSVGVVEGIMIYVGLAILFRFSEFSELLSIIRKK